MSDRNATVESRILAAATALAIETALKIGDQPAKLVVRKKSQAYLYGRLAREFPAAGEAKIREVIAALRWVEWPEDQAPPTPAPERRPIRGREAVSDPCWLERVAALVALVVAPLGGAELVERAQRELNWGLNFAIQVLAAAEELGALEYVLPHWSRAEQTAEAPPPRAQVSLQSALGAPVVLGGHQAPGQDPDPDGRDEPEHVQEPAQLWLWPALRPDPSRASERTARQREARRRRSRRCLRVLPGQLALRWGPVRGRGRRGGTRTARGNNRDAQALPSTPPGVRRPEHQAG